MNVITRTKAAIAFLCIATLMTISCSKDSSTNSLFNPKISAQVDGKAWSSLVPVTTKSAVGFTITATQVSTTLVTSELIINIFGSTTGTYAFSLQTTGNYSAATYIHYDNSTALTYIATAGKTIISSIDTDKKTISGTFEYTCTNLLGKVEITNGTFTDLSYKDVSVGK